MEHDTVCGHLYYAFECLLMHMKEHKHKHPTQICTVHTYHLNRIPRFCPVVVIAAPTKGVGAPPLHVDEKAHSGILDVLVAHGAVAHF